MQQDTHTKAFLFLRRLRFFVGLLQFYLLRFLSQNKFSVTQSLNNYSSQLHIPIVFRSRLLVFFLDLTTVSIFMSNNNKYRLISFSNANAQTGRKNATR